MYNTVASRAIAVTPNDTTLIGPTAGIWVGGAGDLVVDMALSNYDSDYTDITFNDVPAGTLLPISVIRVKAATTCTLITAVYF